VVQVDASGVSLDQNQYLADQTSGKMTASDITITGADADHLASLLSDSAVSHVVAYGLILDQNQYLIDQASGKMTASDITITGADADHLASLLSDPAVAYVTGIDLTMNQYLALPAIHTEIIGMTVSNVDASHLSILLTDPYVNQFSVVSGTQDIIPYSNVSSLSARNGYSKVSNFSDLDTIVSNVPATYAAVYSTAHNSMVDHLIVQSGSTMTLSQTYWNFLQSEMSKIDFTGVNINVTGVLAAQALSLASNPLVTSLSLATGQELDIPTSQYSNYASVINKIQGHVVITTA
jgi:galactitol-specific phosphotransferase system IIB component